jgi:hypothetical protein
MRDSQMSLFAFWKTFEQGRTFFHKYLAEQGTIPNIAPR